MEQQTMGDDNETDGNGRWGSERRMDTMNLVEMSGGLNDEGEDDVSRERFKM